MNEGGALLADFLLQGKQKDSTSCSFLTVAYIYTHPDPEESQPKQLSPHIIK